ncbi:hypothetical protein Cfor_05852 [Coptotermes formosanus]|uniref:DNA primase large subunit C-terminal domain-containing protein n=1 Tax=Coptotermes formosanus TaxID=36987 RepID=A0A6L2PCX7_COPFO|nr:hypothetical protein Cfor_05852 [Coptotermes formosanus]
MTYYLKPPRGTVALHTLRKCVQQRFEYLVSLQNGEMIVPRNFEYLIDGSSMDRTGHFMLRLLSLSSPSFKMFVLEAETKLFINRLSALSCNNVTSMLKILYRHVKETVQQSPNISQDFIDFVVTVKHVCKIMIKMEIAVHAFKETHLESCSYYNIHVPFRMCLPLVKKREVELKSGKCIVPCGKWKHLLAILFYLHLELGMKHLKTSGCVHEALNDPRIYQLAQDLGTRFNNNTAQVTGGRITAQNVNAQSVFFPPCMVHLYKTLQFRHRLTHESRRQLTLFLKDVGMPIEEALDFWRTEYSQPRSECGSGCTHSWQKDARRYQYSIRHMYGLEGGRYTYRVPSCRSIQLLNDKTTLNKILHLKASGKPHEACHLFHAFHRDIIYATRTSGISQNLVISGDLFSKKSTSSVSFVNPVQYYLVLTSQQDVDSRNEKSN